MWAETSAYQLASAYRYDRPGRYEISPKESHSPSKVREFRTCIVVGWPSRNMDDNRLGHLGGKRVCGSSSQAKQFPITKSWVV
jgi:hypothetical protein